MPPTSRLFHMPHISAHDNGGIDAIKGWIEGSIIPMAPSIGSGNACVEIWTLVPPKTLPVAGSWATIT
jgi:hypothetical protein